MTLNDQLGCTVAASQVDFFVPTTFVLDDLTAVELRASQACTLKTNTAGTNEVQRITITGTPTGGTFTVTFGGQTTVSIAYNASAATVQTALQNLTTIGIGNVSCAGGALPGSFVSVTFQGALGLQNVAAMTTTDSFTGGSSPASAISTTTAGVAPGDTIYLAANSPQKWTAGTDHVWTVTITGTPSGGTFKLVYAGQATTTIAYNASAATVQADLEALSTIGSGNVTVSGSAGGPYTITGALDLSSMALSPLIAAANALTGGTAPSVTVAVATQGVSLGSRLFTADVTTGFYITTGANPTSFQAKVTTEV